jgi:hypothetical protein
MTRKVIIFVAILAAMCWAGSALAYTLDSTTSSRSFSTADGNLSNVFSEAFNSGTATATFSIHNVGAANAYVEILLTNTTSGGTPSNGGVLAAAFWTSATFFGGSGTATGTVVNGSLPVGKTLSDFWGYASTTGLPFGSGSTVAGNQGVSAVGLGFGAATGTTGFTPLSTPGSNANNIDGINYTIVANGTAFGGGGVTASPVVEPSVDIHLNLPFASAYSFTDPEAWWGTATGNTVPLPPSALLMGTGLLGLGLVGWRRRSRTA